SARIRPSTTSTMLTCAIASARVCGVTDAVARTTAALSQMDLRSMNNRSFPVVANRSRRLLRWQSVCPDHTTRPKHQSLADGAGRSFTVMRHDDGKIFTMPARAKATVEDLYRFDGDGKAELVNGELVVMSPGGGLHGFAATVISGSLLQYAKQTKRG